MFIELHMIQNFSPANLNRDDTNNPKDCEFGGHRRARISSQSLKRAIRYEPAFGETTKVTLGERSKWMSQPIAKKLVEAGKDAATAAKVAIAFVSDYAAKSDKKDPKKTNVLVYYTQAEIQAIVDRLLENWDDAAAAAEKDKTLPDLVKSLQKATKDRPSAPDIALFGRMLAEHTELNIDAACQVAHAISTHRVNMEMDFFTAVDDLQARGEIISKEGDEELGAGMMGFTSFNSACFYRYARIDWEQLVINLGGNQELAQRTVEGFLRSAIDAIPTGKQNSFGAQNPTSLAMAVVRNDGKSWNLANAFERPVRASRETGLIEPSIKAFDAFWGNLARTRDDAKLDTVAVYTDQHQDVLEQLQPHFKPSISTWVESINNALQVNGSANGSVEG